MITDIHKKEFEDFAYSVIRQYTPILFLQKHTFKLIFKEDMKDAIMSCKFRYPYLDAHIGYTEKAVTDFKKGENMIPVIIHEMVHVITDPLYGKATSRYVGHSEIEDERENLTDLISMIVLKLQNANS